MIIYLIRHGETEWNRLKKFQGQVNVPLNEIGLKQTEKLKKFLLRTGIEYDYIYTSPLQRCTKMVEIINKDNKPVIIDALLIEMGFGICEGESFNDKNSFPSYHPFYRYFYDRDHYIPPAGGESFKDVENRSKLFLEEVYKKHQDQCLLVLSHGSFIRSTIQLIKNNAGTYVSAPNNCSLTTISYSEEKVKIIEEGLDTLNY